MGRNGKMKPVWFNKNTEADLLKFADQIGNFSGWVKQHLHHAMIKQKTEVDPHMIEMIEQIVDKKLSKKTTD